MAVWRCVDFSVKEAQLLADLTGIETDLKTTENICDHFLEEAHGFPSESQENIPQKMLSLEALCTAAIVRYGRSFVSGVRTELPLDVIRRLPEEFQESHRFFMDLRHKWVAHSVNAFEDNQVTVYLTLEERGPKSIASVSVKGSRVATLSAQDMLRLKKLAAAVREEVAKLIEAENSKVLEYARSLPSDQFYTQVDPSPKMATDDDAGKARKRW